MKRGAAISRAKGYAVASTLLYGTWITMNSFALLTLAVLGVATPDVANELFYGSKEMNAYKQALDKLTVPSRIISKQRPLLCRIPGQSLPRRPVHYCHWLP